MLPTSENLSSILVTGAAGFVAYHLIENLLRNKQPVIGIDNFDPFYSRSAKEQNIKDLREISKRTKAPFTFSEDNICSIAPKSYQDLKIKRIIHLAAKAGVQPSLQDPHAYEMANIDGTLKLLEFAKARKIKEFLLASSSSVYGNSTQAPFNEASVQNQPISPYAATKLAAELLCYTYSHLYQLRVAVVRIFTVYGPRQRPDLAIHKFTRLLDEGKTISLFGDGSNVRDYTYVTDIVSGLFAASKWLENSKPSSYDIFNLGSGRPISLRVLVETLEKQMGKKAKIKWAGAAPGDVNQTHASLTKSQAILGYGPKVSFDEGIADFLQWFTQPHKTAA